MTETHVMLDLETMDTGSNAAIIAIGAVVFTRTEITAEFYCNVNLQSSMDYGSDFSMVKLNSADGNDGSVTACVHCFQV